MPSVAICICKDCGCTDELVLVNRHMITTMPPCRCGGRMQVSRVLYDRRTKQEPGEDGRPPGDGCFDSDPDDAD